MLDLIRVAPEEEKLLRAFAEKFPELKFNVERSLDYRLRVEKEFCRLAGDVGAFTLSQVITKNAEAACTNVATGASKLLKRLGGNCKWNFWNKRSSDC